MNPLIYRRKLKLYCKKREIDLKELSLQMGLCSTYYSIFGVAKGIPFNHLERLIKYLNLSNKEATTLRKNVKYSSSRDTITVDDNFVRIVTECIDGNKNISFQKLLIAKTLHFVGIKTEVK